MRKFFKKLRGAIVRGIEKIFDKITEFDKAVVNDNIASCEIYFTDGSSLKHYRFMETTFISEVFSLAMIYIIGLKICDLIRVK